MAYTVLVRVSWDELKNAANQKKHGVSFDEAQELLLRSDNEQLVIFDEAHSVVEDRFISIGPIRRGLVCRLDGAPRGRGSHHQRPLG